MGRGAGDTPNKLSEWRCGAKKVGRICEPGAFPKPLGPGTELMKLTLGMCALPFHPTTAAVIALKEHWGQFCHSMGHSSCNYALFQPWLEQTAGEGSWVPHLHESSLASRTAVSEVAKESKLPFWDISKPQYCYYFWPPFCLRAEVVIKSL